MTDENWKRMMAIGVIEVSVNPMQTLIAFDFNGEELGEESWRLEFPLKMAVCSTCSGKGKIVNPAVDEGGISQQEFDEDPEFREAYFSGRYDISCPECDGMRVVPWVDESKMTSAQAISWRMVLKQIEDEAKSDAEYAAEVAAERRFGCFRKELQEAHFAGLEEALDACDECATAAQCRRAIRARKVKDHV